MDFGRLWCVETGSSIKRMYGFGGGLVDTEEGMHMGGRGSIETFCTFLLILLWI